MRFRVGMGETPLGVETVKQICPVVPARTVLLTVPWQIHFKMKRQKNGQNRIHKR